MKVLVTGGAGFIGSHVVDHLIDQGHSVVVIDDMSSGRKENTRSDVTYHTLDVADPAVRPLLCKEGVEAVCHVAAKTNLRESLTDPLTDIHSNIVGLVNVLEACKDLKLKKFVFSSTGGALYGDAPHFPSAEDTPTKPISPYGVGKLAGEKYLYYYHVVHDLPVVILRYSNVYGPRQERKNPAGALVSFVDKVLKDEDIRINGDGEQTRDFVHVTDVARANLLGLARAQDDYCVCNISGGSETSVNALIMAIEKATGKTAKTSGGPANRGEIRRSYLSNEKAKIDLGWYPTFTVESGIQDVISYMQKLG